MVSGAAAATVLFGQCAAKLEWPDGARRLIGNDGIAVHIEPNVYEQSQKLMSALDSAWIPG